MTPVPPSVLRRLLSWVLPPGRVRDGLLGDLDELYAERVRRHRASADLWYARQLFSAAVRYTPRRLRARGLHGNGAGMMDGLGRDLGYAFRMLVRRPGFTAVIVLTLALGIGANTAVFSAVDSVLLRPLPYADSDRLVAVWLDGSEGGWGSPGTYAFMRERSRTMDDVAAWSGWSFTVTGDGEAEVIGGARITPNLLALLGAVPLLGRTLLEEEALPWEGPSYAGGSAAILSYGLWQRRYGGDPAIVGRTITIDGMGVPVVGVLAESFGFPSSQAELWLPVAISPSATPSAGGSLRLVGRLRNGATSDDALVEARALAGELGAEYPERFTERYGLEAAVLPLRDDLVGSTKDMLLVLFGAVGFVLLIACANVANLFLARATVRGREMSIRAALGAGRHRLVRQVLTEHVALAGCGAVLGLALAYWGARLLAGALPPDLTHGAEIGVNGRVLAFTVGLTVVAGLLSGLAPALRTGRGELHVSLKEAGRGGAGGPERRRLLESFVVAEVAIAVVLVIGAGLMLQSFWRLSHEDPGFRAAGVLTFRASPPDAFYADAAQREAFTAEVIDRLGALPGVASVGAVHLLPLGGANWGGPLQIESRPLPPGQVGPSASWRVATADYFRTAGIPVIAGRGFTAADRRDAPPVALVSETLARQVFPGEDPIGQRVRTGLDGETWATIVGVVGDTRDLDLARTTSPQIYRPHAQVSLAAMTYMIRTDGNPLALARAARDIVATLDANVPVSQVQPLEDVVAGSITQRRLLMLLLAGFGTIALLMAALGVYGVIGYAVAQRTREFGIRLALGARPADVLRLVVRGGAKIAALGLLAGLAGAALLSRFLQTSLHEIEPNDPRTFAAVAALLGGVALLGSYVPARRAASVDPTASLIEE